MCVSALYLVAIQVFSAWFFPLLSQTRGIPQSIEPKNLPTKLSYVIVRYDDLPPPRAALCFMAMKSMKLYMSRVHML